MILPFDLPTPAELLSAVLPLVVVAGLRMLDVTLGVFRTTFVVSGRRLAAGVFAFAESAVWVTAAGIVLTDLTPVRMLAFALGVGLGTWVGMIIVHHLRLGMVTVRAFLPAPGGSVAAELVRDLGFGATVFDGHGRHGDVQMILSVVRRREAWLVSDAIRSWDADAFLTVDSEPGPASHISGVAGARL